MPYKVDMALGIQARRSVKEVRQMKCFLTSSPIIPDTDTLNPANGFVEKLRACIPSQCKTVFVCSDPENHARTDRFAAAVKASFEEAGFPLGQFDILDGRNKAQSTQLIGNAELLILAGGHVPTQNRFFSQIGLKDLLSAYDGVLVGISAGSMNSAEVVYAQPELEGEALDPAYQKYLPGLGLTGKMILPHYQMIKDDVLDGLRVMEDIAYPDSQGKKFYVLVDGSYLYIDHGKEELCGEAYLLADGTLAQLSHVGETIVL